MNTKGFQRREDPEGGRNLCHVHLGESGEVKVMVAYHGVCSSQTERHAQTLKDSE